MDTKDRDLYNLNEHELTQAKLETVVGGRPIVEGEDEDPPPRPK